MSFYKAKGVPKVTAPAGSNEYYQQVSTYTRWLDSQYKEGDKMRRELTNLPVLFASELVSEDLIEKISEDGKISFGDANYTLVDPLMFVDLLLSAGVSEDFCDMLEVSLPPDYDGYYIAIYG